MMRVTVPVLLKLELVAAALGLGISIPKGGALGRRGQGSVHQQVFVG